MQRGKDLKINNMTIKKKRIVQFTLLISFSFGLFILIGTIKQWVQIFIPQTDLNEDDIVTKWFGMTVIIIEILFVIQSFVLAPLVSKDFKTFTILLKTFFVYVMYSPFYVTYFFINAISNIHDLSWGTRPDNYNEAENNNNPKQTTIKVLLIVIFCDIVLAVSVNPLSQNIYTYIIFFTILAFPSLYQIFFAIIWLIKTRFVGLYNLCKPKRMKDDIKYDDGFM